MEDVEIDHLSKDDGFVSDIDDNTGDDCEILRNDDDDDEQINQGLEHEDFSDCM